MPQLDFRKLSDSVTNTVLKTAKDFYADGQTMAAEDKEFFEAIAKDTTDILTDLAAAKVAGDESKVQILMDDLESVATTARTRVTRRSLALQDEAKSTLGTILSGIIKALGTFVGTAIVAAL